MNSNIIDSLRPQCKKISCLCTRLNVIVIKEETFDTIKIYGFGVVDEVIDFDGEHTYVVKLEEDAGGYVIEADNLVSTHDWVEYVDERCAKVIRVPYEA